MNYFLFFYLIWSNALVIIDQHPPNINYIISLHITPESKQKCKKKISKYIVFVLCSWQENNIYIYIYIYAHTQYMVGESKATTARAASFAATVARAASSQKNTKREKKKQH